MSLAVSKLAPQFELEATDGKLYSLQRALERGSVLAVFFKVACPTCQYSLPFLERISQQLGNNTACVWGISQDPAEDSRRFAKEYGISFPILIDEYPYEISRSYSVRYVPTLYVISQDAHLQITSEGFSKADFLAIHKSLAGSAQVTPPALFRSDERVPEYKPG